MQKEITKYLQEKKVEYKEGPSNQLILEICPSCGCDKWHFYMEENTGLCDCKKCGFKANFNQFRELFGDPKIDLPKMEIASKPKEYVKPQYKLAQEYASRLWAVDTKYLEYLTKVRGLTEQVIKDFKIGSNGTHIAIPVYSSGELVNFMYRRDPEQDGKADAAPRYMTEKGCKPMLFNEDILKKSPKTVFVCEGAFDAMQLIQRGIGNTVSISLGANHFSQDWIEKFEGVSKIVLCYDSDDAGKEGAKLASSKLGEDRCVFVELPKVAGRKKTDLTDYFITDGHTKAEFLELAKNAKKLSTPKEVDIKHISEFNEELRKRLVDGDCFGIGSGYTGLDDAIGGLRKGRLVIVSGLTNVGKTAWCLCSALNIAHRKEPILFFSMEMPPIDIAKRVLTMESKLTNKDLKGLQDPSPELEKVDEVLASFGTNNSQDLPFYLFNGSGQIKYKIFEETAKVAVEDYKCACIFVDHLHYFVQNYGNLTAETSKIVRDIKQLAMSLQVPIVVLAHLNRGGRQHKRKGMYIPSLSDLRESGAIEQDADQVLFVCRDSENEDRIEREKSFLKVGKNRDGEAGRSISMRFDSDITTFIELAEDVDYEEDVQLEEEKQSVLKDDLSDIPF